MLDRAKSSEPLTIFKPEVSPRQQRRVVIITAIVLAIIVGGFYAYQRVQENATQAALSMPRPPTPVEATVATVGPIPRLLSGIGTLQAVHQVTISPEVGGRVVKIFFESGASVKAGDPLVQLFDEPLQGDRATFEAQERLAALTLKRSQELLAKNFQSQEVVDQNQSLLDSARANLAKTKAQIQQMLVRAPFTGELGVRQIEVGGYLSPGSPIVTLTDLSKLWVNFTLPEQAATQIKIGQVVHLKADAYPNRTFDAVITAVEPQISSQTRTLLVQATLSNDDHALLPGMFAKTDAILPQTENAVIVPETAVDYSLYGEAVYLIQEDGKDAKGNPVLKVKRAVVKTGTRFDGKVAILSGLSGGERLVASGQLKLNDGAPVSVEQGNALGTQPGTTRY
jgi:membrane fusion protein, multidrug efflux system